MRLIRAGGRRTLEHYRLEQLAWASVGALVGVASTVLALTSGRVRTPALLLGWCAACALAGLQARELALTHEIRRREEAMLAEFPAIAELLALSVAAGEGLAGALERVSRIGRGALVEELRSTLTEARSGRPLASCLEHMAARTALPPVNRFIDGLCIAIERGTPLADVLRAQAGDAREAGKRRLLEIAGRKELSMMVPVVFLILPVSVVFALYPGFYGLNLTAP